MLKKSTVHAFSLIEVMVVLAIISILATIGHSLYISYVMRAKVNEALKVLEEYQTVASGLRSRSGKIAPYYVLFTDNDTTGFVSGTTTGSSAVKTVGLKYVNSISADTGTSGANSYILLGAGLVQDSVIVAGADHVYLAGIETPAGVVTWKCGSSASKADTINSSYLPKSCLNTLP